MGGTFSEPIPNHLDTQDYVCMVLRAYDKFRLLYAPPEVQRAVHQAIR